MSTQGILGDFGRPFFWQNAPQFLIVPTLRVGTHPVTLRVTRAPVGRGASVAAFPCRAWERS